MSGAAGHRKIGLTVEVEIARREIVCKIGINIRRGREATLAITQYNANDACSNEGGRNVCLAVKIEIGDSEVERTPAPEVQWRERREAADPITEKDLDCSVCSVRCNQVGFSVAI